MIGRRSFFMLPTIWLMGIATGALAAGALMPPRGEIICSPAGNEVNHISMRGIRQDSACRKRSRPSSMRSAIAG